MTKLAMKHFTRLIPVIFFALAVCLANSCATQAPDGSNIPSGVTISPATGPLLTYQDITLSIDNSGAQKIVWKVTDDSGQSADSFCNPQGPVMTCNFVNGGDFTFQITVTDAGGNTDVVTGLFSVFDVDTNLSGPKIFLRVSALDSVGYQWVHTATRDRRESKGNAVYYKDDSAHNLPVMMFFDLSHTTSPISYVENITFKIDFGDGNSATVIGGRRQIQHSYAMSVPYGGHAVVVTAQDEVGNVTTLTYGMTLVCSPPLNAPQILFTPASPAAPNVVITQKRKDYTRIDPDSKGRPISLNYPRIGYYAFDMSGAFTGSRDPSQGYITRMSFEGDGSLNGDYQGTFVDPIYVTQAGVRPLQLEVMDVACHDYNFTTFDHDFKFPMASGTPGDLQSPYVPDSMFIQGTFNPGPDSDRKHDATQKTEIAVHFDLTKRHDIQMHNANFPNDVLPVKDDPKDLLTVSCTYGGALNADGTIPNDGTFSIDGYNSYYGGLPHGFTVKGSGVKDTIVTDGKIDSTNVNKASVLYYTDRSTDLVDQQTGSQDHQYLYYSNKCNASLHTSFSPPPKCKSITDKLTYTVNLDGTVSCPSLPPKTGFDFKQGSVVLTKGAFYCEIEVTQSCAPPVIKLTPPPPPPTPPPPPPPPRQ